MAKQLVEKIMVDGFWRERWDQLKDMRVERWRLDGEMLDINMAIDREGENVRGRGTKGFAGNVTRWDTKQVNVRRRG